MPKRRYLCQTDSSHKSSRCAAGAGVYGAAL